MKRGYLVGNINQDWGVAVVAHTAKEAKLLAWDEWRGEFGDWIDVRAQWRREAIVKDLPPGIIDDYNLALRRGLYDYTLE